MSIKDKKENGSLRTGFKFRVTENDKITIEPTGVSFDEVYLYSKDRDRVITDNRIKFHEKIYIIIEGLKGFKATDETVFPGLRIKATDAANNTIIENDDLFHEYTQSEVAASELARRISTYFTIPETKIKNPLHCEMSVWDKKSEAKIKVTTDMILE